MTNERVATAASTLAIALLILLNTVLHSQVYARRNYREDEINTVHAALIKTPPEIVQWMAGDVHPPGWRLFADFWVDTFGKAEAITRWSSQLLNLLTYALVFQLGKQLIDRRAALYAVALLSVYGFAANGMYEFRPYAMLVALTTGLHLVFYHWLVKPRSTVMILYVVLGIAAIYTHFFAFYIFAAHAVFLVLFHRFRRRVYLDSLLMWVFIALSFSAWIIPLLGVILGPFSGGYYVDLPDELYQHLHFRPEIVFGFLLLLSLFAPRLLRRRDQTSDAFTPLRWRKRWNLLYPLTSAARHAYHGRLGKFGLRQPKCSGLAIRSHADRPLDGFGLAHLARPSGRHHAAFALRHGAAEYTCPALQWTLSRDRRRDASELPGRQHSNQRVRLGMALANARRLFPDGLHAGSNVERAHVSRDRIQRQRASADLSRSAGQYLHVV